MDFFFYEAGAPGVDRAAVAHFVRQATHDPVGAPMLAGHYLFVLGLILLGLGLHRGRVGARWASLCLVAGPVLDAVLSGVVGSSTAGDVAVGILSDGVFLAGAGGLAWWLLTTSNAAWEGLATAGDGRRSAQPVGAAV